MIPDDPRIAEAVRLINEAEALVRDERPRAALERAGDAVRASADLPDAVRAAALHARGRARDGLGDVDAALADLTAARDLEPNSPQRWIFLAQLAESHERWDSARELLATAIEVADATGEPSVIPQCRWELAHIALLRGDADTARREFATAIEAAEELNDLEAAAYAELDLADLEAAQGDAAHAQQRYAHVRALAALLPDRTGPRLSAEPAAPTPGVAADAATRLPAPTDRDPVLRVTFAPELGEHAEIAFWPGDGAAPQQCVVPFRFSVHPRTEERLRWYAEEYSERPIDPAPSIAADVEAELEQLGEALFDELFGHPESAAIADRVRADIDGVRVEVVADVLAADQLPWELLRDPATGTNLALAARAITRTSSAAAATYDAVHEDGEVRILIVIARPQGRLDVGFRSVADPLLRELRAASAPVSIDVLRPPRFEQLEEVLRAAQAEGRPYDLVHFDGHGVLDPATGRSALLFESGDETGRLVHGDVLGDVLGAADVPLLVMNACRSAAVQHGQPFGSVARQALERGLAGVVAMRFNVYVPTAALFVAGLYRALGAGRGLEDAVTHARRLLTQQPERDGLPVVRDWCVPALYQAAPVRLAGATATRIATRETGLPPPPGHGFVGRDEVFVELEAALLTSPHVVLRATSGAGKTSVAAEFARWYAQTGGCGIAGPRISLARAPSGEQLRGPLADRPLLLWDDVRALDDGHRALLDEIAASGGRVLIVADRPLEPVDAPLVTLPNMPRDEGLALALAVASDAGARLTPETAEELASRLRGHALAIELAARELARRGDDDVESLLGELAEPENGDPAPWIVALGEPLEIVGSRAEQLVAQFSGYLTVVGFAMLRDGSNDFDAAEAELMELRSRGVLTRITDAAFAIHPGLAVALASAGRYEVPGRAFAEAMARTASAWTGIAEMHGAEAPWAAEASNLMAARRMASREGWWPLVIQLLDGISAIGVHTGRADVWHAELHDAAPDFVDAGSGEPRPGMEEMAAIFVGHLASLAELEGDYAEVARMRAIDVKNRRAAAADALAVGPERRNDEEYGLVRRLVVGLTNLGSAQSKVRASGAVPTMREAIRLAREIGEWRLQALNHLNLGAHWMTVPSPPEFDRAEEEFAAGYELAIEADPPLAGKLMTERGTVQYERGRASGDPAAAQAHYEKAADLLELAVGLREPDAVLFHQLGQVHRHLGNFGDARAWFEQTIALADADRIPGSGADARLHLALTLEAAGLVDEALSFARSAEQLVAQMAEPDPDFVHGLEQTLARVELRARA